MLLEFVLFITIDTLTSLSLLNFDFQTAGIYPAHTESIAESTHHLIHSAWAEEFFFFQFNVLLYTLNWSEVVLPVK